MIGASHTALNHILFNSSILVAVTKILRIFAEIEASVFLRSKKKNDVTLPERLLILPLHFPFHILFGRIRPLVVKLFTTGQPHLYLYQASLKIHGKRNQGIALLRHFARQLVDLRTVHQKLPDPQGILVENVAFLIGIDVHPVDVHLSLVDADKGLLDAAFSHT